jgi:hypothetical protein
MMARVREDVRDLRRKQFIVEMARTNDPVQAAKVSGHPAERALETLRDLGFTLTVLEPPMDVAA